MGSNRTLSAAVAACLAAFAAVPARAGGLEFESSGGTYLQYYLTQDNRYNPLPPGYRFAFSLENLIYRTGQGHWFINAANSTLISRSDTSAVQLDMIRYKIEPGFRLEGARHEADFLLSHECIHQIDKVKAAGSVFWNALEADVGSAGAFDHNLIRRVVERDFQMRNSLDYRLKIDAFLFGDWLYWVDQNHDYRGHAEGLLRYNWALWRRSAMYVDFRQRVWVTAKAEWQAQSAAQANWILLSRKSIGVLFAEFTLWDQNPYENENSLFSLGLRILY